MAKSSVNIKITSLPTRYEPLISAFGEKARTTFVSPDEDLADLKRFLASAESSGQGKIMFVTAKSGAGKSTFIQSLEVFLADRVETVLRLPLPHELEVGRIPGYLAKVKRSEKFTIVNFDGREAPYFNEPEYQTFLGALNGLLRSRRDLVILWPVTDMTFADRMIELLEKIGGRSAFAIKAQHILNGVAKSRYSIVLDKILQIANWRLDDAAISASEVEGLIMESDRIGEFLDRLQSLISQRFDVGEMGVQFPTLVLAVSSSDQKIRETMRSVRRADSYYIEASRLLMYTRRSNVAEWWASRATDMRSALPHVVALFNAQLVSLSASAVVHSIARFGTGDLKTLVEGVRVDKGNARRVMGYSELYKYIAGGSLDNREYGTNVKEDTTASYDRIQAASASSHRNINKAILDLVQDCDIPLDGLQYETALVNGLQTDAAYDNATASKIAIEFHHKAASEATQNKISIYILEKLQEYAINYGLATR